ncbi:MAG: transposase, partial [Caldisericaceae bacterium]|nr:transposase [Caldisericaceae bacterium]
ETCRLAYNFNLNLWVKYYKHFGKSISVFKLKKYFNNYTKSKYPRYQKTYNKWITAMFFRLNNAIKYFFEKRNKYPKFKRKGDIPSLETPGEYIKVIDKHRFVIPTARGEKNIIARTKEEIPDKFSTIILKYQKGEWYACFIIDVNENNKEQYNPDTIAIDLGVKTLATGVSTQSYEVIIPKFSHYTKHLDWIRSKRDKKKKYSRRWKKWNKLLQKRFEKYTNRIKDYLHKASKWLMTQPEDTIVLGKLNLEGMKTEKSWFNRIIQNEWRVGMFCRMLDYKSQIYGKRIVYIDERNTTKTCSKCGYKQDMQLSDRIYNCPVCGNSTNRDLNSAWNILKKYCTASALECLSVTDSLKGTRCFHLV